MPHPRVLLGLGGQIQEPHANQHIQNSHYMVVISDSYSFLAELQPFLKKAELMKSTQPHPVSVVPWLALRPSFPLFNLINCLSQFPHFFGV
jgi:hypothetical protein